MPSRGSQRKGSNFQPKRRQFLRSAATAAAGGTALAAASFPTPAISQGLMRWRLQTALPRNFPGLGTGPEKLAAFINNTSGGKLTVEVFGGGEIVPPMETMEAVSKGEFEMGHSAPYYWRDKEPASQVLASLPFGLTAQEQNAWLQFGGGAELADKVYARMGCKFFACGNTGSQGGGWFNKEVNAFEDLKGLRMRIPGMGGDVIKAAGGVVINLPGIDIIPALQAGVIDATEWLGPFNDLAFGLHKSAKYYYFPGWHEPATIHDAFINLASWKALPKDLQAVVSAACAYTNAYVLNEFVASNNQALFQLKKEHGVEIRKFPDSVLNALGRLSGEVVANLADQNPLSREVLDSIAAFRRSAIGYAKFSEQAFYNARLLPFDWAKQESE